MLEILFSASINMSVILEYITVLLLKKYIPFKHHNLKMITVKSIFMRVFYLCALCESYLCRII